MQLRLSNAYCSILPIRYIDNKIRMFNHFGVQYNKVICVFGVGTCVAVFIKQIIPVSPLGKRQTQGDLES